jgi:diguanylate cyclase (GGDEF)-like protein
MASGERGDYLFPMPTNDLLTRVSIFQTLERGDIARLAAAAEISTFEAGEAIVEIGDPGRSLFILVEGSVQVLYPGRSADFELARLGPGDFFGEMALLNDKPRSATVRAQTAVRTLRLAKEAFQALVRESPQVALKVMEVLSIRVRTADEQIGGLSEHTQRDALTHLLNRRALQERLTEECDRYRRYGVPFSIVLLDLDHFRDINEMFGHDVGDTTLAWVGRLLAEHTRAVDVPFRIGGEEFALLCPSTRPDPVWVVARRFVELVGEARPPVSFDLRVTVSAGFAGCPDHGRLPEEVFGAAEKALLQAKQTGRNRACASVEFVG